MYCKYCGSQIADNSVFCSKCGKLVVDAYTSSSINTSKGECATSHLLLEKNSGWMSTQKLQWKKPLLVRVVQCIIISIALFWGIYSIVCLLNGGEVYRYFGERRTLDNYSNQRDPLVQYEENLYIRDYWRIFRTKSTKWNEGRVKSYYNSYGGGVIPWAFSYDDIQREKDNFRLKVVFLGIVPALIVLWLTKIWIKRKPFPQEKDGLPRDFADELEEYELYGFCKHKYVFFKKNGKYGVIDAAQYRVNVPAQYDTIAWRTNNKTYDGLKDGEERTYVIEEKKEQTIEQCDNMLTKRKTFLVIGVILALWAAFLIIADLIDIICGSYGGDHVAIILISSLSGFGAYFCIKYSRKEL